MYMFVCFLYGLFVFVWWVFGDLLVCCLVNNNFFMLVCSIILLYDCYWVVFVVFFFLPGILSTLLGCSRWPLTWLHPWVGCFFSSLCFGVFGVIY